MIIVSKIVSFPPLILSTDPPTSLFSILRLENYFVLRNTEGVVFKLTHVLFEIIISVFQLHSKKFDTFEFSMCFPV